MKNFSYKILSTDSHTKNGLVTISNKSIETPIFMPVASCGSVKSMPTTELKDFNYKLILVNIYHLYIRPGIDAIVKLGNINRFIGWEGFVLSDSGGYQIYSLRALSKLLDKGFEIKSYIDGKTHLITPEDIISFQKDIGVNIITTLDICTSYGDNYSIVENCVIRSNSWAERSKKIEINQNQAMFGIIQGGIFKKLREISTSYLLNLSFDGLAIGGLSVGEPKELTWEILEYTISLIPKHIPVYLMGVGTPEDILNAVSFGVDMFDCVLPTRLGRTGTAFSSKGKISIKNKQYKFDNSPLDEECNCKVCRTYSKGYIRHLFNADEIAGPILLTYHNLYFYDNIMVNIRNSIKNGNFKEYKTKFLQKYLTGEIR